MGILSHGFRFFIKYKIMKLSELKKGEQFMFHNIDCYYTVYSFGIIFNQKTTEQDKICFYIESTKYSKYEEVAFCFLKIIDDKIDVLKIKN